MGLSTAIRGRWTRGARVLRCALCAALAVLPVAVMASGTSPVAARSNVPRYIGESFQIRVWPQSMQMCVGERDQVDVLITQDGVYEDPPGTTNLVPRMNGSLARGQLDSRSSNRTVVNLARASSAVNGSRMDVFTATADQVGTAQLEFTYSGPQVTARVKKTVSVQVTECDYKVDTSSLWHVNVRRNVVAMTVVHTVLQKRSSASSTVFDLATQGQASAEAENTAGSFSPPCVGMFELPNTSASVTGELDLSTRTVKVEMAFFDVPIFTAVDCGVSGGASDVSVPLPVDFSVGAGGGASSRTHVLDAKKVGRFSGVIFYTVTPVHR